MSRCRLFLIVNQSRTLWQHYELSSKICQDYMWTTKKKNLNKFAVYLISFNLYVGAQRLCPSDCVGTCAAEEWRWGWELTPSASCGHDFGESATATSTLGAQLTIHGSLERSQCWRSNQICDMSSIVLQRMDLILAGRAPWESCVCFMFVFFLPPPTHPLPRKQEWNQSWTKFWHLKGTHTMHAAKVV